MKSSKADLLEWLDETMDPYWGYYGLAGSDGAFSEEIFCYIKELLGVLETVRDWEVDDSRYEKWLGVLRNKKNVEKRD